jgi:alcohol dehydrogenase class IV
MAIHKVEMPSELYYGPDSLSKVGEAAAKFGKRVLLVSDRIMKDLGHVEKVTELINEKGGEVHPYLEANSEPTDIFVDDALAILKDNNCDTIVSIGGGSCIDTAKAVAVVATNGGYIGDYMGGKTIAEKDPVPLITIPTTAGTGSEVTNVTVITNTKEDIKMMIKQHAFLPKVAIVDPNLTMTAPNKVTAATGMDALCHAIESYISNIAHPMTRTFSLEAIDLILNNIQTAFDEGDNVEARTNMSLAAMEAGIAFSNASVTLVHGMSRPIGAMFHIPHGVSNSMLLPAVLEFSRNEALNELADIAKLFLPEEEAEKLTTEELADATIKKVKELSNHLEIPNLKTWGVDEEEFEKVLDKMATDALDSGSPGYNPRVPSHEEIVELYRTCYDYDFSS